MNSTPEFQRLETYRMDIAFHWAMRWLVRHFGQPAPDEADLTRYYD